MQRGALSSFAFMGRMSRRQYWLRFPVLVAAPLFSMILCWIVGLSLLHTVALALVSATPLFSAGYRRLQDTSERGSDAVAPWGYFIGAVFLGSWSVGFHTTLQTAFASDSPPDGPGGLAAVIIYGLGGSLIGLTALYLFVVFLVTITPAVAQTLLPSTPGPNKYGPNPNEVPS